jgi:hypothetical protein
LLAAATGKVAQIVAGVMEKVAVWDSFSVTPLSGHTGAEIASIALSGPVRKPTHRKLNQASLDHVIAMRDQNLNAPSFWKR